MLERRQIVFFAGLLGVTGCWPIYKTDPAEGSGTGSSGGVVTTGGATIGTTTGGAGGTSGVMVPGSSIGSSDGGGASTGGTEAQTFVIEPDTPVGEMACDVLAQDCPLGQKCTFYAESGGSSWDASKCVPVMEDPASAGEECFVVGNGVSGIDNCDVASYCWDTNAENVGVCVEFCTGSLETPICPPGDAPVYLRSIPACICIDGCDPLAQDCAMDDDLCLWTGGGFLCVLDASGEEGQVHDPCEYSNSCDKGLSCVYSTEAVECDQAAWGCCEPFCDLSLMNTCPGQGQVCESIYEEGQVPVGYEKVGLCGLP